jgi:hypothetical protein
MLPIYNITESWGNSFHKYLNFSDNSVDVNITGWILLLSIKNKKYK